jgi:hypothetical protein
MGRHPDRVLAPVAHEAPVVELLPDAAAHRARGQEGFDTYRSQGVGPAMQKFMTAAGLKGGPPQPAASQPSRDDGIDGAHRQNAERFSLTVSVRRALSFLTSPPCGRDRRASSWLLVTSRRTRSRTARRLRSPKSRVVFLIAC